MLNLRLVTILIGFLVMMHGSIMSLDPHGQAVTGHDSDHSAVTDLVCDESDAMSPAARPLTDSAGGLADLPRSDAPLFALDTGSLRGWRTPAASGDSLRAMLQVFLN